jgi:hypothetical protein
MWIALQTSFLLHNPTTPPFHHVLKKAELRKSEAWGERGKGEGSESTVVRGTWAAFGVPKLNLTNTLKMIGSCAAKWSGPLRHGPLIPTWFPFSAR